MQFHDQYAGPERMAAFSAMPKPVPPLASQSVGGRFSTISSPYSLKAQTSNLSVHHPVLDDSQFAPPPRFPKSLEVTKAEFSTERRDVTTNLPAFHEIKHSGEVNARFSLKTLLINKKWRPTFWIMFGSSQVLFFRSKTDFDEWVSNPFLQKPDRDKLVKLAIDVVNDLQKSGLQMTGYKVTPLRIKTTRDGALNAFKLERWFQYGPSVVAAFGGRNASQVQALHSVMTEIIAKSGNNFNMEVRDGFDYPDSDMESGYNSDARDIRTNQSNLSFSTMSLDSNNQPQSRQQLQNDAYGSNGGSNTSRQSSFSRSKILSTFRSRGSDASLRSSGEGSKFRISLPRSLSFRKPPRAPSERSHLDYY